MEPENQPLEKEIPIGNHHFEVPCKTLGVYYIVIFFKWVGPTTNTFDVKIFFSLKGPSNSDHQLNARWDLPSDLLLLAIFDERFWSIIPYYYDVYLAFWIHTHTCMHIFLYVHILIPIAYIADAPWDWNIYQHDFGEKWRHEPQLKWLSKYSNFMEQDPYLSPYVKIPEKMYAKICWFDTWFCTPKSTKKYITHKYVYIYIYTSKMTLLINHTWWSWKWQISNHFL